MGIRRTSVRPHLRKGRAVVGHDRKVFGFRRKKSRAIKSPSSFDTLVQNGSPPLRRQKNISDCSKEFNKIQNNLNKEIVKIDGPFNLFINKIEKKLLVGGGVAAASTLVGGVASLALSVSLLGPFIGVGLLAGSVVITFPVFSHAAKTFREKRKAQKAADKLFMFDDQHLVKKHLRDVGKQYPWTPTSPLAKKSLVEKASNFLTKITPDSFWPNNPPKVSTSNLAGGGVSVSWSGRENAAYGTYQNSTMKPRGKTYFYPGVDLSDNKIIFRCDLRGANLAAMKFSQGKMYNAYLDGANLQDANLYKATFEGSMRDVNFKGANLSEAKLNKADLVGANFEGANLDKAVFPSDLTGIDISTEQFESLWGSLDGYYSYPQISFEQAVKELGITDEQFEFLVFSNVVKVRDNKTTQPVLSKYDPEKHHIGPWCMKAAKKSFSQLKQDSVG